MQVKPKLNYHLLGTNIKLRAGAVYDATPADNQPKGGERGCVFVNGVLLERGEYTVVENSR